MKNWYIVRTEPSDIELYSRPHSVERSSLLVVAMCVGTVGVLQNVSESPARVRML